MTNEEFQGWKHDPRTKEILKAVEQECYDLAIVLAHRAGVDQLEDRFTVGVIRGMEKILEIDYEEAQSADTAAV